MAQKHQLFLDFPQSTNEGILRIEDCSIYTSSIPVNCLTLEITPPGHSTPTVITGLQQHFKLFLNACGLGLLVTGCDEICPIIQDGIYHFRFSTSPNTTVYVEYNLLRTTVTRNKLNKTLCWINSTPCSPSNDSLQLLREVQLINNQITSAEVFVNDLHDYETGMEMVKYARKKLLEISRGCHQCQ